MGVEIEIEGGFLVAVPLIQETLVVSQVQFMDQDSGFLYLVNGALTAAPPAHVTVIDKSNFLGVPATLNLSTATDLPFGIVQRGAFIYVVAQSNLGVPVVYEIAKNLSSQARFASGLGQGMGQDPFIDGIFVVAGGQQPLSPNFGVGRFDTVGHTFTQSNVEGENIATNFVRNDVLNNEYYTFSQTSGGCTPAITIVNRGTFTFTPLGGLGVCTNPAIMIPYRWGPFSAIASFFSGLVDSSGIGAFGEITGPLLARQNDRSSRSASTFASIAWPLIGNANNCNCWAQESVTSGSFLFVVDNAVNCTVGKIQKNPLGMVASHGIVGRGNANSMRIDDIGDPQQFFYVLTLGPSSAVTRFSKGFLIP